MQVAITLLPDIKLQKISERRIRLKWTKCSPRTKANLVKTDHATTFGQEEAQTSPTPSSWGQLAARAGRPTYRSAVLPRPPTAPNCLGLGLSGPPCLIHVGVGLS